MPASSKQPATTANESLCEKVGKHVRTVLIVDDQDRPRQAMASAVARRAQRVICVNSMRDALRELAHTKPELVLLDFALTDGDAFDLLDHMASLTPQPIVIVVSGEASVEQSFALAQRGVRYFLQKPFSAAALDSAIEHSLTSCIDFRAQVRAAVGHRPIHELESEVRNTMLVEALARTGGNRRGAARLLAISRQLLQHMLRAAPQVANEVGSGDRDAARR